MKLKTCAYPGCTSNHIWKKSLCKYHSQKLTPPKLLKRVAIKAKPFKQSDKSKKKQMEAIKDANVYYKKAIAQNIINNKGKCLCDECGSEILNPTGSNVSHLISKGANAALYFHTLNHFIFCFDCEQLFSNMGKREMMNIYAQFEVTHELLNNQYYESK